LPSSVSNSEDGPASKLLEAASFMHSAPSVTYPVGRSRFAAALLLLLWLLGGGAIAFWGNETHASGGRLAIATAVWIAAGVFAGIHWWRSPTGTVVWDGESWNWSGWGADTGALQVNLDLQRFMLIRCAGSREAYWFWLERASRPERWDDLRRAVYSRATPGAHAAAPPAKP
jgi:toxin CptA